VDIRALLIAWVPTLEGESAMSYDPYTPSTPGKHRIHPAVPWVLFLVALAILAVGTVLDNPVWMLSAPVALGGSIIGGLSRRYLPMILCILVASVFVMAMLIFAP